MPIGTDSGEYFDKVEDQYTNSPIIRAAGAASQDASRIDSKPRTDDSSVAPVPTPTPESSRSKYAVVNAFFDMIEENKKTGNKFVEDFKRDAGNIDKFLKGEMTQEELVNSGAVFNMASNFLFGGRLTAPVQPNSAGVIGGQLGISKVDPAIKELLPRLEKALPEAEITKLTGWWKDKADGKWKKEIPDKEAKFDAEYFKDLKKVAESSEHGVAEVKLGLLLEHPKVFNDIYPEMFNYKVEYDINFDRIASFDRSRNTIMVGPRYAKMSDDEKIRVLLHETQHGIQKIEDFARGGAWEGTPSGQKYLKLDAELERAGDKVRKLREIKNPTEEQKKEMFSANQFLDESPKLFSKLRDLKDKAMKEYMDIPGEVEARKVESKYMKDMGKPDPYRPFTDADTGDIVFK